MESYKTVNETRTKRPRGEPEGPRREPNPLDAPPGDLDDPDPLVRLVLEMDEPPPEEAGYGHGV